jgi:phosphatidylserine/phosphatidylglycerophosphate/cardiolipin synthase-like enzyme
MFKQQTGKKLSWCIISALFFIVIVFFIFQNSHQTPSTVEAPANVAITKTLNSSEAQAYHETVVTPVANPTLQSQSWYALYFTDSTSKQTIISPDKALITAVENATESIDIAIHSFSLKNLRDALMAANNRGIKIRIVIESNNIEDDIPQALKDAGIPIIGDRREGLMHNKFAVIDNAEVWTGSMNFTSTGAYLDNNNLICIRSKELAADYTNQFNEMFERDLFGPGSPSHPPYPKIMIDGSLIEVFFSPDGNVADRIIELLSQAQKSIHFMTFSFTSDDMAQIIIKRAEAGVKVWGIFEDEQYHSNFGTQYDTLKREKLNVRLDGNQGQMHHKVFIIDKEIVVTGSYNFSYNAENKNDENLLIIHNSKIAAQYLEEFKRVYAQAQK